MSFLGHMLGFFGVPTPDGDHSHGVSMLGAVPIKKGGVVDHKAVAARAVAAASRAVASGQSAVASSKTGPKASARSMVLGAVSVGLVKGKLTAKQQAAVKKHDDAVARQSAAGKKAAAAGKKALDAAAVVASKAGSHKKALVSVKSRAPAANPPPSGRRSSVVGDISGEEMLDTCDLGGPAAQDIAASLVGGELEIAGDGDEYREGFEDGKAGRPEATAWWGGLRGDSYRSGYAAGAQSKYQGRPKYSDMDAIEGDANDFVIYDTTDEKRSGIVSRIMGTILGAVDADAMRQSYGNVPGGGDLTIPGAGVPYDGSRGLPENGFASWNHVYGSGDGFVWAKKPPRWVAKRGNNLDDLSDAEKANMAAVSEQYGWGPLVSNAKNNPELAGLRWAKNEGKWFWLREDAPAWATKEADDAAALLAAQTQAAEDAAAAAEQARLDKIAADQAEAQAAQDAANALAESAATSQQNVAQTQAAAADALVQQQLAAQQAQLDIEAQRLALQQEAAYAQWAASNPEAAYAQQGYGDSEWQAQGYGQEDAINSALEEAVSQDIASSQGNQGLI